MSRVKGSGATVAGGNVGVAGSGVAAGGVAGAVFAGATAVAGGAGVAVRVATGAVVGAGAVVGEGGGVAAAPPQATSDSAIARAGNIFKANAPRTVLLAQAKPASPGLAGYPAFRLVA